MNEMLTHEKKSGILSNIGRQNNQQMWILVSFYLLINLRSFEVKHTFVKCQNKHHDTRNQYHLKFPQIYQLGNDAIIYSITSEKKEWILTLGTEYIVYYINSNIVKQCKHFLDIYTNTNWCGLEIKSYAQYRHPWISSKHLA